MTNMIRKDALRQDATLHLDKHIASPWQRLLRAPTIFHEPWWLDVTTQGRIEMVESREHGKVVGRLYFLRKNRYGIISSNMPPFTHFLGPAIDPGPGSPLTRHSKAMSVTADLIEKLPRNAAFRQKMHRGITDVLAFQAANFDTFVQFTYEIAPEAEAAIWSRMRDKTRNAIRNGEKLHDIAEALDPDGFIDFYRRNIKSTGMTENVDLEIARLLTRRCLEQGCGKFLCGPGQKRGRPSRHLYRLGPPFLLLSDVHARAGEQLRRHPRLALDRHQIRRVPRPDF